jgi:hypothetical protein
LGPSVEEVIQPRPTDRLETQPYSLLLPKRAIKNAAAHTVSDIAEFKIRDTTLVSLSSQLQNFIFCNFFFKISEIKTSSGFPPDTIPFHTHTAENTVYRFLPCRQHPF